VSEADYACVIASPTILELSEKIGIANRESDSAHRFRFFVVLVEPI